MQETGRVRPKGSSADPRRVGHMAVCPGGAWERFGEAAITGSTLKGNGLL